MKKILQGETGHRDIVVDAKTKVVDVTHLWKKDKDGDRYQLNFKYEFDISETEILRLAALWVNKDLQNRMRTEGWTPKQLESQEKEVISVAEFYAPRERMPRDPKKAAQAALSKLSPEELKEILAGLSK